jgi:putative oxidoreductase
MSANATLALIGRILIALIFAYFGYRQAVNFGGATAYFGQLGFPLPAVAAALAVTFQLGGALLLIAGWRTRWAAWALVLYTIIATAVAHRFWSSPPGEAFNQSAHFFKNVSLIGGLITLAAFGPGALSVDKR